MSNSHYLQAKIALILFAIAIFAISLPIHAQKNYNPIRIIQIHANPINIASRLIFQKDSAQVASTLEYYGYNQQLSTPPSEGWGTYYQHPDGTTIQFSFPQTEEKHPHPIIKVYCKTRRPQTVKILEELDYKKNGDHYENIMSKYSKYLTKCSLGPDNSVTFERKKK